MRIINKPAENPATMTSGENVFDGFFFNARQGHLVVAFTKGGATSVVFKLKVQLEDGTQVDLETTSGAVYNPFGTMSANATRHIPIALGTTTTLPSNLIIPILTFVGTPNASTAVTVDFIPSCT